MYVLYALMRVLTVFGSVGSRTRMSPTGAGRAPLPPPGTQATIAGCAPVRIWNARNVLIRDVAPAPVERQLASSVVVVPAIASNPPLNAGVDIAAAGNMIGAFATCTTPIRIPFKFGAPAVSWLIIAS